MQDFLLALPRTGTVAKLIPNLASAHAINASFYYETLPTENLRCDNISTRPTRWGTPLLLIYRYTKNEPPHIKSILLTYDTVLYPDALGILSKLSTEVLMLFLETLYLVYVYIIYCI